MNLHDMSVAEAGRAIQKREVDSVALVKALYARIKRLDPSLQAWVTLDEERALATAKALGDELRTKGPRGPLHGVPLGVKDIYYTKDLLTTACSTQYLEFVPTYDATSVARLKEAGAIILGKCVTAGLSDGDKSALTNDYPYNPWDRERNAGGSSNGSAVSVAARMVPGALGSQTGGSVLKPSGYNGVVGLKPTYGRISRYGVIPRVWTLDTMGIIVRSVEDAALVLQTIAGHDPNDPGSSTVPVDDYVSGLKGKNGRPPRIGLIKDYFYNESTAEVRHHTDGLIDRFRHAGATVQEVKLPKSFYLDISAHSVVNAVETASFHGARWRQDPSAYPPNMRRTIETGLLVPGATYLNAQRARREFRMEMNPIAASYDVLITPTLGEGAPRDRSNIGSGNLQGSWTSCGLPAITLPSGLDGNGMPLGLQVVGAAFTEAKLLAVASWCEALIGWNHRPKGYD